MDDGLQPGQTL